MRRVFSALVLLCLAGSGPLGAQSALSGTVTWKGKPVKAARVRLPDSQGETVTDAQGRYSFSGTALISSVSRQVTQASAEGDFLATGRKLTEERTAVRVLNFGTRLPAAPGPVSAYKRAVPAIRVEVTARGFRDTLATRDGDVAELDVSLEKDLRRHLWIWGSTPVTSSAERDSLFAFSLRKGIGTLYLDCAGLLRNNRPALIQFIKAAKAKGLCVELLFGAPQWALPANHGTPVELAQLTLTLLASLKAEGAAYPTSIQMDVEPYSLPAWDTDQAAVAGGLLDMYVKLGVVLEGTPVGVTACIPRWFDGIMLERGGRTRPLSDWLADASERLTLMDYVDNANGIIAGAEHEIAYADGVGKEVVIGVETIPGLDPESVTFAEEGEAAMESALGQTSGAYRDHPAYFGIAIHHWDSYPSLKP